MEEKKEKWTHQILNSAEQLKPVGISESLRKRLETIPLEFTLLDRRIPMKAVWMAAASIALLLTVNIVTVRKVKMKNNQTETEIYSDYFSYLDQI